MTHKSTKKKAKTSFDQSQPKRGGPPIPTSPLVEVRNSEVHGRGVFAVADIAKGTRIFEYLGDRVSHAAADARYEDHDENDNHTFLFIVDRNTVIDAAVNGSDARFINHHCDGNCTSVIENRRVFIDAVRAIAPGEELGYDYEIGRDKDDPPNVDEIYACRCGSPKCRGSMLEAAPKKKAAKQAAAKRRKPEKKGAQDPSTRGEASRRTVTPARMIDQLAERGFGVADDFVDSKLLAELRERCVELHLTGGLRPALVGRGDDAKLMPEVRGDFISWLEQPERDAEQRILARLDELRATLNRALMTGLEDFQGHFALYPRGAGYARHFDRLVGSDVRAISAALYLNDRWAADDGGELRLYTGGGASFDVLPQGGRLVAFQSDRFEHEVLPARRERMSFTGWFRRRPLEGFV